jgi:conjugative transposon TraN protein
MRSLNLWVWLPIVLLGYGFRVQAGELVLPVSPDSIGSYPLELAERFTTNLIFPFAIANVDLGSGDIIAKKLGKTENVLLLKAGKAHFAVTNLSVYLENGRLYSFRVSYADSLTTWNYCFRADSGATAAVSARRVPATVKERHVPETMSAGHITATMGGVPAQFPSVKFTAWPVDKGRMEEDARLVVAAKPFLRARVSSNGLGLALRGVYLRNGLLWLSFRTRNRSLIDFKPDLLRCSLEDRKRVRRTAVQSIELPPVYVPVKEVVAGGSRSRWAMGLRPLTVAPGKKLVVEWSGDTDGRRLRLVIPGKYLLRARNLNML